MNRPTERLNGRPRYLAPLLLCLLVPGVLALGACKKGEGAGPEGPDAAAKGPEAVPVEVAAVARRPIAARPRTTCASRGSLASGSSR